MALSKTFQMETAGNTLIIIPCGSTDGLAGPHVKAELDDLIGRLEQPELANVVIDLGEVSYFGTMMLGAMRIIWCRLQDEGGTMALCNVSTVGREILRVSGFDTLWPICNTRPDALKAVDSAN